VKRTIIGEGDKLSKNQKVLQQEINENRKILLSLSNEIRALRHHHSVSINKRVDIPEQYDSQKVAVAMRKEIIAENLNITDLTPDGDRYVLDHFGIMPEGMSLIVPFNETVWRIEGDTVELLVDDVEIYSELDEKETRKKLMEG